VKVLLDTHVWIWWLLGSERLSLNERRSLDRPFAAWLRQAAAPGVVAVLPFDVDVVLALEQLPQSFHGDPADRLIVATAHTYGLPLATHDSAIQASGVVPIWQAAA
jgi:PIN domain nuclease of toxin-antitoxin system